MVMFYIFTLYVTGFYDFLWRGANFDHALKKLIKMSGVKWRAFGRATWYYAIAIC